MPFEKGQKAHNFKDLTGEKFNMLTVKSFYEIKNGMSYWLCVCDCGNEKILSVADLKNNKSCGCAKKNHYTDLSGYENDDIIVLSFAERRKTKIYWNCQCKHCGNVVQREGANIRKGLATCKCVHKKRIGESNSKPHRDTEIYSKWCGMKNRCYNSNENKFNYYGGRGIAVCDEWLNDFDSFYEWSIKNGWQKGYSIERKDVNSNYCPENCCWVPLEEQAKNKRNTIYAVIDGEKRRLVEWCDILNINPKTVYSRIHRREMTPEEALLYSGKRGK